MTRVALVLQGDAADPRAWSGIPAGICGGLEAAGVTPVPIDARFPGIPALTRALRVRWTVEAANPVLAAAGGRRADRAIRVAGDIDGAIKIGSGYELSGPVPVVTYEDMTIVQALSQPDDTYSSLPERSVRRWRDRQASIYRSCRACCAASAWAAGSIQADYGVDPARVHVVGFGTDLQVSDIARDWSVPRYVFIGRDWERKRGDAVVRALARVREHHPSATLDLVGEHPPIDAPGVTGHGVLRRDSAVAQDRLRALLARATCLVLPSVYEPFGIAYLEAAAAGIPSVGTTVGGAPDAVGDGGIVVEPDDDDALTAAMLALADRDAAREMGEVARDRVPLFTWSAVAERLLRALELPGVDTEPLARFLPPPDLSTDHGSRARAPRAPR